MMTIKIGGVDVDIDDPCAVYQALYAVKLKRLANEQVSEVEIKSPVGQRRMQIAGTSMDDLNVALNRLADACQKKTNGKRTRFAKSIRWHH